MMKSTKKELKKQRKKIKSEWPKEKKPIEPKLKDKDAPTWRERLREIAEEPVIYDSVLTKQSVEQIKKILADERIFLCRCKR